jgi:hypothetical protein
VCANFLGEFAAPFGTLKKVCAQLLVGGLTAPLAKVQSASLGDTTTGFARQKQQVIEHFQFLVSLSESHDSVERRPAFTPVIRTVEQLEFNP